MPKRADVHAAASGLVCDDSTDIGPPLQALINAVNANTSTHIFLPPGRCRLASAVTIQNAPVIIEGEYYTDGPNNPGDAHAGTILTIVSTGFTPFTITSPAARGTAFHNFAVWQQQPNDMGPGWSPSAYDYVFKIINTVGEVGFENISLLGVTNGIYSDGGGQLDIRRIQGQVYDHGILFDNYLDIGRIQYARFWPYVTQLPDVLAYTRENFDAITLKRSDGQFIDNLFVFGAHAGLYLTAGVNGSSTKTYVSNYYDDLSKYAILIDAPNTTLQISNLTSTHNDPVNPGSFIPGGAALKMTSAASNVLVQALNWRTDLVQSNVIDIEGSGNTLTIDSFQATGFDNLQDHSAAIHAVSGNKITVNTAPLLVSPNAQGGLGDTVIRIPVSMNMPTSGGPVFDQPICFGNPTGSNLTSCKAIGADTNIDFALRSQGTGSVDLQGGSGHTVLRADDALAGDTDVLVRSTVGNLNLILESASANANLNLAPKGAGIVTATGGFSVSGPVNASTYSTPGHGGVSCSGAPTASFTVSSGIVTHC